MNGYNQFWCVQRQQNRFVSVPPYTYCDAPPAKRLTLNEDDDEPCGPVCATCLREFSSRAELREHERCRSCRCRRGSKPCGPVHCQLPRSTSRATSACDGTGPATLTSPTVSAAVPAGGVSSTTVAVGGASPTFISSVGASSTTFTASGASSTFLSSVGASFTTVAAGGASSTSISSVGASSTTVAAGGASSTPISSVGASSTTVAAGRASSASISSVGTSSTSVAAGGANPISISSVGSSSTSVPAGGAISTSVPAGGASSTSVPAGGACSTSDSSVEAISTSVNSVGASSASVPAGGASSTSVSSVEAISTSVNSVGASFASVPAGGTISTSAPSVGASSTSAPSVGVISTSAPSVGASSTSAPAVGASSTSAPAVGASSTSVSSVGASSTSVPSGEAISAVVHDVQTASSAAADRSTRAAASADRGAVASLVGGRVSPGAVIAESRVRLTGPTVSPAARPDAAPTAGGGPAAAPRAPSETDASGAGSASGLDPAGGGPSNAVGRGEALTATASAHGRPRRAGVEQYYGVVNRFYREEVRASATSAVVRANDRRPSAAASEDAEVDGDRSPDCGVGSPPDLGETAAQTASDCSPDRPPWRGRGDSPVPERLLAVLRRPAFVLLQPVDDVIGDPNEPVVRAAAYIVHGDEVVGRRVCADRAQLAPAAETELSALGDEPRGPAGLSPKGQPQQKRVKQSETAQKATGKRKAATGNADCQAKQSRGLRTDRGRRAVQTSLAQYLEPSGSGAAAAYPGSEAGQSVTVPDGGDHPLASAAADIDNGSEGETTAGNRKRREGRDRLVSSDKDPGDEPDRSNAEGMVMVRRRRRRHCPLSSDSERSAHESGDDAATARRPTRRRRSPPSSDADSQNSEREVVATGRRLTRCRRRAARLGGNSRDSEMDAVSRAARSRRRARVFYAEPRSDAEEPASPSSPEYQPESVDWGDDDRRSSAADNGLASDAGSEASATEGAPRVVLPRAQLRRVDGLDVQEILGIAAPTQAVRPFRSDELVGVPVGAAPSAADWDAVMSQWVALARQHRARLCEVKRRAHQERTVVGARQRRLHSGMPDKHVRRVRERTWNVAVRVG
ncbi:aggrecan core protein-like [Pollicipes pollicipes]|uniref:aggrecan core protein-like n=1 Tax=Pollicipes pollicipes TaxID=41117 RepID=UPI0018857438|nr:aggrecan core protein-like [Pollicipes pollicipes]